MSDKALVGVHCVRIGPDDSEAQVSETRADKLLALTQTMIEYFGFIAYMRSQILLPSEVTVKDVKLSFQAFDELLDLDRVVQWL